MHTHKHSYVIETATCYVYKKYTIFPPRHVLHINVLNMIETHETINTLHVGAMLVRVVFSISGFLEVVQTIKKRNAKHIGV